MITTSLTLLERLRQSTQPEAWERFVRLYAPMLLRWAELERLRPTDAEDLVQNVLVKLLRLIPSYERREGETFRGWLFTICRNECRDFRTRRATRDLPGSAGLVETIDHVSPDEFEEKEYRRQLVRRTLEVIQSDFAPETWAAFRGFSVEGRPAAEVAAELGLTANAVYLARNRVVTRLREELGPLLD